MSFECNWLDSIITGRIAFGANEDNAVEIVIGGDICPIDRVEKQALSGNANVVLEDLAPFFRSADFSIVNLECPLTKVNESIKKTGPSLRADPLTINVLLAADIKAVTLANNHILDQGFKGLEDTVSLCNRNGIQTVGTGANLEEAAKPLLLDLKGKKIAIFSLADHEYSIATKKQAGANPLNPALNYQYIQEAKKNNDHVIVIIHAGNEHYSLPSPQLRDLFHFYADAGATAVIGHHPHCPGGIEIYKGVPLFYSLGNLVFDESNPSFPPWYIGFILKLKITDAGITSLEVIPYTQYRELPKVQILDVTERVSILQEIQRLSQILTNDDEVGKNWDTFCQSLSRSYVSSIFQLNRIERFLLKKNFFKTYILPNPATKSKILNLIRCDAHRNVLINLLLEKKTK